MQYLQADILITDDVNPPYEHVQFPVSLAVLHAVIVISVMLVPVLFGLLYSLIVVRQNPSTPERHPPLSLASSWKIIVSLKSLVVHFRVKDTFSPRSEVCENCCDTEIKNEICIVQNKDKANC